MGVVNFDLVDDTSSIHEDNDLLGNFHLDGIPPDPWGSPQMPVAFAMDASGISNVSAQDKSSGKSNQIAINENGRLLHPEFDDCVCSRLASMRPKMKQIKTSL